MKYNLKTRFVTCPDHAVIQFFTTVLHVRITITITSQSIYYLHTGFLDSDLQSTVYAYEYNI